MTTAAVYVPSCDLAGPIRVCLDLISQMRNSLRLLNLSGGRLRIQFAGKEELLSPRIFQQVTEVVVNGFSKGRWDVQNVILRRATLLASSSVLKGCYFCGGCLILLT